MAVSCVGVVKVEREGAWIDVFARSLYRSADFSNRPLRNHCPFVFFSHKF